MAALWVGPRGKTIVGFTTCSVFFFNTKYICVRMCVWMMRLPNINEYIQFEFQLLLSTFYCRKRAVLQHSMVFIMTILSGCIFHWWFRWSKWRSLRFSYDYFFCGRNGLFCVMVKHPERLLQRDICWLGHFRSTHFRRKERSEWKADEMFIYTANVQDKINICCFAIELMTKISDLHIC